MRIFTTFLIAIIVLALLVGVIAAVIGLYSSRNPSVTVYQADPVGEENKEEKERVKLFLIALGEEDASGPIGCGDYAVPVFREVLIETDAFAVALENLFALKEIQVADAPELVNVLSYSDLELARVSSHQGKIRVDITGTVRLSEHCDSARVEAQIMETIRQFPNTDEIEVYINNQPLSEALSTIELESDKVEKDSGEVEE